MTTKTTFEKLLSNSEFTLHHVNVAIGLLEMPDIPAASREHTVEAALAHLRVAQQNLVEREEQ